MTVRRPDDLAARKSKAITGAISKRLQKGFGKNPGPGFPSSNRNKRVIAGSGANDLPGRPTRSGSNSGPGRGTKGPIFGGPDDGRKPAGSINTGFGTQPYKPGNPGMRRGVKPGGEDTFGMTNLEKSRMTKLKNRARADGKQTRQETKRIRSRRRQLQNTTYQQRQARKARGDNNAMVPMKRAKGGFKHPVGSLVNSTTNNPFISGAASRRLRRR